MKKVLSVTAVCCTLLFLACTKSHTCTCTFPANGHDTTVLITEVPESGYGTIRKPSMKKYCKSENEQLVMLYTTASCHLD